MKNIKKVTALVAAICLTIGLLSGCTAAAEGKALYDAMVKSQSIKSSQNEMQFALSLDASGLSEQEQSNFAQMKAMLDGAQMTMNIKQTANADNTAAKAQADLGIAFGGMSINDMGLWVDMDLKGSSPKFVEIIKLPALLTAADPSMTGKEYMVMDLGRMMNAPAADGQLPGIDYADMMEVTKELQAKADVFMTKYMMQYDPGFKFITDAGTRDITTPEGTVKAHVYQVKLDDKAAKKLVRYTVNNFADNKDAMDFAAEYMKLIQKFTVTAPGAVNPAAEFDKVMADFEKEKPALLAEFNKFMDQLEPIQIVGAKGITMEYAVDEKGYIVNQSGSMDFVIDTAKLESLGGAMDGIPASKGVFNVGIDFSMLTYNINKAMTIEMPAVTPENSIDYMEMLQAAVPVPAEEQTTPQQSLQAIPTSSKVLVNGKTVSFDSYTINGSNYFKLRDLAKAVSGTQKQFDVTWDGEKKTINLISNKEYTAVGYELTPGDGKAKAPVLNASIIMKDGVELPLSAYTINGNNYFKLRDIAQAFNIGITWDGTTNTIGIDTASDYVAP